MVAEPSRKVRDGAQPGEWAVDLADRDRAAERGDRIAGELEEFVVPGENLRPVGFPAVRASSCSAAMAAWIWYSPRRSRASAACRMATPWAISASFHRVRSCLSRGMSVPCSLAAELAAPLEPMTIGRGRQTKPSLAQMGICHEG